MSYTIGYRMPMRDRPRVRVRLVYDYDGPTEATRRALDRLAGLPDGTVVEALRVVTTEDTGGKGGETKVQIEPSETPAVYTVWGRRMLLAASLKSGSPRPVSPSDLAYPSEDGGMSSGLPSNDALSVLVTMGEEEDWSWEEDEEIAALPDGSVVECAWEDDGDIMRSAGLMYGRSIVMLVDANGPGGGLS